MAADSTSWHFVVLPAAGPAYEVPIEGAFLIIGSGAMADIRLADPEVASEHAAIERRSNGDYLIERRATPFFINGLKVRQHVLASTDLLTLGRTSLSFRSGSPRQKAHHGTLPATLDLCRRLNGFTTQLEGGASAEELTKCFLTDVLAFTGAARGVLVRFAGSEAETIGLVDATRGAFSDEEAQFSQTIVMRLRDTDRALLVSDAMDDPDLALAPSVAKLDAKSVMCVPIRHGKRMVGALYASSSGSAHFSSDMLQLLGVYAAHASKILALAHRGRTPFRVAASTGLPTVSSSADRSSPVIGSSSAIDTVRQQIKKVARHDVSVLLIGETGTGKDVIARELHRLSRRCAAPFVAVNCGAIPEALLQTELFGHAAGAFTHAIKARQGHIRMADGGTLFLDEIGDLTPAHQVALLRVIHEKVVDPVGSEQRHVVDFRLVCATNRDLDAQIAEGAFRQDLFYRIADVVMLLPPLRERGDDAIELANHFLHAEKDALSLPDLRFSAEAMAAIRRAHFPGNVRQLGSCVRRGALLCEGAVIKSADLGLQSVPPVSDAILPLALVRDEHNKAYVRKVVERLDGNRTAAAKALRITVRTVFKYLEEI